MTRRALLAGSVLLFVLSASMAVQAQVEEASTQASTEASGSAQIPVQFRGKWAKPIACNVFTDFGTPPLDGVEIDEMLFYRNAHGCKLESIIDSSKTAFSAVYLCGIQGRMLHEQIELSLSKDRQLSFSTRVISGDGAPQKIEQISRCK